MEPSKSILRRRTPTAAPPSAGRGATPTSAPQSAAGRPTRERKRVEITSPPQSTLSNEDATVPRPKIYKQTPLPRVALLSGKSSRKTLTRKESSRIAIKLKSIRLRAKRSPSIPSHRISKSRKRKSKKSKASAVVPAEEKEPKIENVKEMGTINQIMNSVVANPSVEGSTPPLTAEELGKLLRSVGNVAKMQENVDVSKNSTSTSGKDEGRKTKSRKSKSRPQFSPVSNKKAIKLSNYLPLIKQGGTSTAKVLFRAKEVSSGKLSRGQLLINKAAAVATPITPTTYKAPVRKLKSMKSQVKALIKEQLTSKKPQTNKSSRRRSRKSKDSSSREALNKLNSDSTLNAMSDLDLIKSAILNKRYYEESLALAQSSSKDQVTVEESPPKRKTSQTSTGKKQKLTSTKQKVAPKRLDVMDDENKILDSYATYMGMNGIVTQPTGKDLSLAELFMKNRM